MIARKVTKQDIEGFMSAFVFNQHGGTAITNVAPLVFEKDPIALNRIINTRVRANPPPAVLNQGLETANSEVSNKRLRALLVEIESKAFESKPRFYKAFTGMDVDGDGYISYADFEQHLAKNKIHASRDEVVALMHNVLDTEKKGYVQFSDF